MATSYYELRRDELLWEAALRLPTSTISEDFPIWSTDHILRNLHSITGNILHYCNVYSIFSPFDIQTFLSQIFDLQSKVNDKISSKTSLSNHQITRLRSRIVHYVSKIHLLLILYPGIISDSYLLAENILVDILNNWASIDKSIRSCVDFHTFVMDSPAVAGEMNLRSENDEPIQTCNRGSFSEMSHHNVIDSGLMVQHSVQHNTNLLPFRNLDSPLLRSFLDKHIYTGSSFRDVLLFLGKVVHVTHQLQIWKLSNQHAYQVFSQYTADKLLERVELALLRQSSLEEFHEDILAFFLPQYIQQQLQLRLLYRVQYENENLPDFIKDIKLHYAIFRVTISEYDFVRGIISKLNVRSRMAVPMTNPPRTFVELDKLVSQVQTVHFQDRLAVYPELAFANNDVFLNLGCHNGTNFQSFDHSQRQFFRPQFHEADRRINRSHLSNEQIQPNIGPRMSRVFHNQQHVPRQQCYRCGSYEHFVRNCTQPSRRFISNSSSIP